VAFNKDSGKEVWKATDYDASYSSRWPRPLMECGTSSFSPAKVCYRSIGQRQGAIQPALASAHGRVGQRRRAAGRRR